MLAKGPFTTPQVAAVLGIPLRKLLSFIERGYVSPSIQDAAGHGSRRLWSYEDLVRCTAVKFLSALSVGHMRLISDYLIHIKPDSMMFIRIPATSFSFKRDPQTRAHIDVFGEKWPHSGAPVFVVPKSLEGYAKLVRDIETAWPVHVRVDFDFLYKWADMGIKNL